MSLLLVHFLAVSLEAKLKKLMKLKTHTLSAEDHTLLKKNRNQIELLNGQ